MFTKRDSQDPKERKQYSEMMRAAELEILIAECHNAQGRELEKIYSFKRATELYLGMMVPIDEFQKQEYYYEDVHSIMSKISPYLVKMLLDLVKSENEEVQIAALRGVEFLLEKLGCTLDNYMIDILRSIVIIYPNKKAIDAANEPMSHSPSDTLPPMSSEKHRKDIKSQDFTKIKERSVKAVPVKNKATIECAFKALKKLIQVILDKYVSVLSSISSNILHQIFFDLLVKTLSESGASNELKSLLIKIAEKIISICQGDLILNKKCLDSLLSFASLQNIESLGQAGASLWQSIRTKIMCNYSHKGMKDVIEWIAEQFFLISEKDKVEENEVQRLITLLDMVSLISVERLKIEEDTNNLIRLNTSLSMDLYLLLNPVIYWMKFSIEREDRLHLFKASWKTIKDIIMALPEGIDIDLISIILPIFERVCKHLDMTSPSLPMLKFLEIILQDVSFPTSVLKLFLKKLIPHIPFCIYDEIYSVFQIVLNILYYTESGSRFMDKQTVQLCLKAFTDKNTNRTSIHKKTVNEFVNQFILCLNTNFETEDDEIQMIDIFNTTVNYLVFNNKDITTGDTKEVRELIELHTTFKERITFFIDIIQKFKEIHINLYRELLLNTHFHTFIFQLLKKGELELRIKSHEILEILSKSMTYLTKAENMNEGVSSLHSNNIESIHPRNKNEGREVEIITPERLALIQLYYRVAKMSLETENDFYLQFSALILLDNIFQNLMPVPSYANELYKRKNRKSGSQCPRDQVEDIENMTISNDSEFECNDPKYLAMRLSLVFKLWEHIQKALNSPWSNIRSICYGLICSMLKIDISDYNEQFLQKIKRLVIPLLVDLLSSRESESKAGGLNILGSLCGLSYDFTNPWYRINDNLDFFNRNTKYVDLPIWQYVFDLQEDWDITIKEASAVLIQLCAPRESISHFYKVKREGENLRLKVLLNNFSAGSPDVGSKHKLHQIMNYISSNSGDGSSVKSDRNIAQDASEYANQSRSSTHEDGSRTKGYPKIEEEKKLVSDQKKILEDKKAKEIHSSSSIYDEEVRAYNKADPRQGEEQFSRESYQFEFYVDNYSDDKIKEIISIFRNDFKPPKNLWIENMNIQGTAEANYFNDVFADDDNYNESEDSPGGHGHNEEIDDIGYNISDTKKKEEAKKEVKKEVKKDTKKQEKKEVKKDKEEGYADRIKPMNDIFDTEEDRKRQEDQKDKLVVTESKDKSKDSSKPFKTKPKTKTTDQPPDIKVHRAKDGLNIEINNDVIEDPYKKSKESNSAKSSKKGSKTPKQSQVIPAEEFNKTHKLPSNLLDDLSVDDIPSSSSKDEGNNISIGKIARECEDEINEKLQYIEEERARLEMERLNKRRKEEKKGSKSKPRSQHGHKSNRDTYGQKKKRPHSHKKRGSAVMMQELKKKMGFINAQTSRGRGGEKFLNYSLDEINQKLQAHVQNYSTASGNPKGMKKRLNKSFENVFSACASTSRAKGARRSKKSKKKPTSSSPQRLALRDKKNSQSHAKTPNTTSRKKLNNSLHSSKNQYNAKDLADKLCLINFSSMPSTPTGNSFIKKYGEKMNILKAEKEKMIYNF